MGVSLRRIRPAGEPLPVPVPAGQAEGLFPGGYQALFVQSGTAALALALLAISRTSPDRSRRVVLLPAYACPDLVTAVDYAGLVAEVVDTAQDAPFMAVDRLEARLDGSILAVVGVHFLGLPERMTRLAGLCGPGGIALIEDSAQRIPGSAGIPAEAPQVVMSFGRGKPAGAIGGGALLIAEARRDLLTAAQSIPSASGWELPPWLQRRVYNAAIQPALYGIVSRLPGLHVGETRYRELPGISQMGPRRVAYCCAGVSGAIEAPTQAQRALRAGLALLSDVVDVSANHPAGQDLPLVRYPLLLPDRALRDRAWHSLDAAGLGASFMYGAALPDLPGVRVAGSADQARRFADRLLTLPVHSGVSRDQAERMLALLAAVVRRA